MSVWARDTVREQVVVAVHDTVMETKTITITKNEDGDTTFTSIVTERDRVRDRAAVRDKEEKLIVHTDTGYIERRDSVLIQDSGFKVQGVQGAEKKSNFVSSLKWIFAIVCAIIVLIILIKIGLRRSLF